MVHKVKKSMDITGEEIFLPTTPEDIEKQERMKKVREFKATNLPTKPEEVD
jgi:hypothetical protein